MNDSPRLLVIGGAFALANFSFTRTASATGRFPGVIYRDLYSSYTVVPYQPPCSLCHVRGSTGPGTAQTPFALSMKAHGLIAGDNATVIQALNGLTTDKVDSDNDGIPDVQEIEDDTDPNSPADVSLSGEPGPNAGCGGGQKANFGGRPASAIGILGSAILVWMRRRSRSRQSHSHGP